MQQKKTPKLLNVKMVAKLLGRTEKTVRNWNTSGLIPEPMRIGRSLFWRPDELDAWLLADCPARKRWKRIRSRILRQNAAKR